MIKKKYIKCPLNYVGGKTKLLPQILPLFPENIDSFYDIFVGGANVLVNVEANRYIGYDIDKHVIDLLNMFKDKPYGDMIMKIDEIIKHYQLSKTNEEGYYQLRSDYNEKYKDNPTYLFMLISHAFNYQMRFNSKGSFNMPFGKNRSYFSNNMKNNLIQFTAFLKNNNIEFDNSSYTKILEQSFNENDFIYVDPPYLNTTAVYNENGGWTNEDEKALHKTLDKINELGIKFALSNVKNVDNVLLEKWSKKYNTHFLNHNYSNSSYQKKDRSSKSAEILITNY